MPSEEWWENLEEPLQRPGQMQKHEPRFGYTERRLDPCWLLLVCLAEPGVVEKAFQGRSCWRCGPSASGEGGWCRACVGLPGLAWSGPGLFCAVLCRAVPRRLRVCGLCSGYTMFLRQSSKLQTVDVQGRENRRG